MHPGIECREQPCTDSCPMLHADRQWMSGLEQARFWKSSFQRAEVIAGAELTVLSLGDLIIPSRGAVLLHADFLCHKQGFHRHKNVIGVDFFARKKGLFGPTENMRPSVLNQ